jgi:hypothetical protein
MERRYPMEEFARRGDEIYRRKIEPKLNDRDKGKFVAIDIETGNYEIALDELSACDRLQARFPEAQTWLIRVGSRSAYDFGLLHKGTRL